MLMLVLEKQGILFEGIYVDASARHARYHVLRAFMLILALDMQGIVF